MEYTSEDWTRWGVWEVEGPWHKKRPERQAWRLGQRISALGARVEVGGGHCCVLGREVTI